MKKIVLVTGSSGHVGRIIVPAIRKAGLVVRGMDILPKYDDIDEFVEGDLHDFQSVRNAVSGADLVIHLAGCSDDEVALSDLVGPNFLGIYNVFEAMRRERVRRIVLASSIHTVDIYSKKAQTWRTYDRCPTTYYGLLKVAAEDMGKLYYQMHDINCIAPRFGWIPKNEMELEELSRKSILWPAFLSEDDLCRFICCCTQRNVDGFRIIYVVSRQNQHQPRFDLMPAIELLGYEPKDYFEAKKYDAR